ncbi:MAG TPA: energy transducer TonB [Pyrinomonadaceae bacterium]|nr:energy transducer TonB [Pyrinomonadaceae bacterium]
MRAFILALLFFGFMLVVSTSNAAAQQLDRPFKILYKPKASLSGDCGRSGNGTVELSVTFDKSAKVTNVEELELSECLAFNRNAIKAAKGIKFQTEIKNGEAITVIRRIVYKYNIF